MFSLVGSRAQSCLLFHQVKVLTFFSQRRHLNVEYFPKLMSSSYTNLGFMV